MSEKISEHEDQEFIKWVSQYQIGKPYWSTARVEVCRDAWMARAKRDAAPDLLKALRDLMNHFDKASYDEAFSKARTAIEKATGEKA